MEAPDSPSSPSSMADWVVVEPEELRLIPYRPVDDTQTSNTKILAVAAGGMVGFLYVGPITAVALASAAAAGVSEPGKLQDAASEGEVQDRRSLPGGPNSA